MAYMAQMDELLDLNLTVLHPTLSVQEMNAQHGEKLWVTNPKKYNAIRKIEPILRGLSAVGTEAMLSGFRASHASQYDYGHGELKRFEKRNGIVNILPLLHWTDTQVDHYLETYRLPRHPLSFPKWETHGMASEAAIQQLNVNEVIEVYSAQGCKFSLQVQDFLQSSEMPFTVLELDIDWGWKDLQYRAMKCCRHDVEAKGGPHKNLVQLPQLFLGNRWLGSTHDANDSTYPVSLHKIKRLLDA